MGRESGPWEMLLGPPPPSTPASEASALADLVSPLHIYISLITLVEMVPGSLLCVCLSVSSHLCPCKHSLGFPGVCLSGKAFTC